MNIFICELYTQLYSRLGRRRSKPRPKDLRVYVPANDEHENIFIEPEYLCGPGEKYRTI